MIDSGFIFQNPHRHVAVLDVSMLEKRPMSDVHVHIDRTLFITVRFNACQLAGSIRALCVHEWREVGRGWLLTSNYRDRDYSGFSFTDVCRQSGASV